MQFKYISGIDISKKTIDLALTTKQINSTIFNNQFSNDLRGYQAMATWLDQQGVDIENTLICMENTGIYYRGFVVYLQSQQAFVWVENPLEIKNSMGLQRGKCDGMDAKRICLYAYRIQDKAKSYNNKDKALQKLADLLAARERLFNAKNSITMPIQELASVGLQESVTMLEEACSKTLDALKEEIDKIESRLATIIQADTTLKTTYDYASSVPGVGFITTIILMVYSRNFGQFDNVKQLASYSGVAPFPYSSGTRVRGKNQVHPMVNKAIKKALHICALSAIRHNTAIKAYYERKLQEGKNKMGVINAVRNKILHRIYACLRDHRIYDYKQAA